MTRQATTQHLAVLEAANLVSTVRRGREKLHYLNPVPLHQIQERSIDKFERPRLRTLSAVKQRAENAMTSKPSFVYVVYIESTPEKVWHALTDAEVSGAYWGHSTSGPRGVPGPEPAALRVQFELVQDVVEGPPCPRVVGGSGAGECDQRLPQRPAAPSRPCRLIDGERVAERLTALTRQERPRDRRIARRVADARGPEVDHRSQASVL